jgi:hypothetical protein
VVRGKKNKIHLIPAEEGWVTMAKGKEKSISIGSEITFSVFTTFRERSAHNHRV